MKTTLLAAPFLLAVVLVVYVEGDSAAFAAWNALPVVVAWCMLMIGRRVRTATAWGLTAFAVFALLFVVFFHLSWLFDWDRTATGSSTSALIFIFIPPWAFILGSVVGVLAWGVRRFVCRPRAAP